MIVLGFDGTNMKEVRVSVSIFPNEDNSIFLFFYCNTMLNFSNQYVNALIACNKLNEISSSKFFINNDFNIVSTYSLSLPKQEYEYQCDFLTELIQSMAFSVGYSVDKEYPGLKK